MTEGYEILSGVNQKGREQLLTVSYKNQNQSKRVRAQFKRNKGVLSSSHNRL